MQHMKHDRATEHLIGPTFPMPPAWRASSTWLHQWDISLTRRRESLLKPLFWNTALLYRFNAPFKCKFPVIKWALTGCVHANNDHGTRRVFFFLKRTQLFFSARPLTKRANNKGHFMGSDYHYLCNETRMDSDWNKGGKCTLIDVNSSPSPL